MNVKEIWSKHKKNIIACIIVVLLCASSFVCGRYIRIRRAQTASTTVEQSISGAGISANKIADGANAVGGLLGTIDSNTDIAIGGIKESSEYIAELESVINECKSALEVSQRELENSIQRIQAAAGTADYLLELAEIKAEQNERTLSKLTELLGQSNEGLGE